MFPLVFLSSHRSHTEGGLSPDAISLQGTPFPTASAGTLLLLLATFCSDSTEKGEARGPEGERGQAFQSSRPTGLRGLASEGEEDAEEI